MNTLPASENGRDEVGPWFALAVFVGAVAVSCNLGPVAGLAFCAAPLWAGREEGATS